MKIKEGFILRDIAGSWVVVPLGKKVVEFNGMMTLNESGALLWKKLQDGAEIDELISSLLDEYIIDEPTARADVQEFVNSIKSRGLLE